MATKYPSVVHHHRGTTQRVPCGLSPGATALTCSLGHAHIPHRLVVTPGITSEVSHRPPNLCLGSALGESQPAASKDLAGRPGQEGVMSEQETERAAGSCWGARRVNQARDEVTTHPLSHRLVQHETRRPWRSRGVAVSQTLHGFFQCSC